jgi:hypothetical protein
MIPIALATEDALSEAIGQQLLRELGPDMAAQMLLRKNGSGYLRARLGSWCQMAQRQAVVILTDLDRAACPAALLDDWFGRSVRPVNLLLRVAVREAESWLMADHQAMRQLIGKRGVLPAQPDDLPDPKRHLLRLAKLAPRQVRLDLVKDAGAASSQGIGYNARLTELVHTAWNPERAAQRSPQPKPRTLEDAGVSSSTEPWRTMSRNTEPRYCIDQSCGP